jgi:hypothetical protein
VVLRNGAICPDLGDDKTSLSGSVENLDDHENHDVVSEEKQRRSRHWLWYQPVTYRQVPARQLRCLLL